MSRIPATEQCAPTRAYESTEHVLDAPMASRELFTILSITVLNNRGSFEEDGPTGIVGGAFNEFAHRPTSSR
jgi:hypothetical protein